MPYELSGQNYAIFPDNASYLFLVPINGADHLSSLHRLAEQVDGDTIVFDLGK